MPFSFVNARDNWPGSSGSSAGDRTGASGAGVGTTAGVEQAQSGQPEYVYFDSTTGTYRSSRTRQPFSGVDPATKRTFSSGQPTGAAAGGPPAATGNPNQDYAAVNIPKSPALASAADEMLAKFQKTANTALQDFGSYLAGFKTDLGKARTAADAATNIQPTVDALKGAQQTYAQDLSQSQREYAQTLANTAAAQRGVVATEQGMLPQYNTSVDRVTADMIASLGPQMARYKLGDGQVPTAGGSAEQAILARETARIAAPMEVQKLNRAFDIQANQALPVEQGIGREGIQYAGSYLPQTAGSLYSSASGTATAIQGLKDRVAGMTLQNAMAFMQASAVPAEVQARVLGLEIGQLQQIAGGLMPSAYYQGLNYLPGASLTPTIGADMSTPGLPNSQPRVPQRQPNQQQPGLGGGAPREVNAGGLPTLAQGDRISPDGRFITGATAPGYYYDRQSDQAYPIGTGPGANAFGPAPQAGYAGGGRGSAGPGMADYYYDPATGMMVRPDGTHYNPVGPDPSVNPGDYALPYVGDIPQDTAQYTVG